MEITSVGQFQRVKWGKKEGKKEGNGKLEGGGGGGGKEWRKTKVPIIHTPCPRYNVSCQSRVRTTINDPNLKYIVLISVQSLGSSLVVVDKGEFIQFKVKLEVSLALQPSPTPTPTPVRVQRQRKEGGEGEGREEGVKVETALADGRTQGRTVKVS